MITCTRRALPILLLLTACGPTGYGPAMPPDGRISLADAITPRTKGGTLNITPQTKGSTLKGSIVWPAEVAALSSKRFIIRVYAGDLQLAEGATDAEARFEVFNAPAQAELRIEAHVPGRPHVILRRLVQLPGSDSESPLELKGGLSMLSTAAAAVLLDARQQGSGLGILAPDRLLAPEAEVLLKPLASLMTPYLDASLAMPIESLAPVQAAISTTRGQLEKALLVPIP